VKRFPNVAAIVIVLACFQVSGFVCNWPEHMVARIPVKVSMDSAALNPMGPTCGFKVTEQGSNAGTFVIVALDHERAARDYLTKAGLLR
jgi:hypothetical protein